MDNKVLYEWCKHDELFKMMAIMMIHDDDYEEGDDYKEDSNNEYTNSDNDNCDVGLSR